MSEEKYSLVIENIGEDIYTLLSRGHHDIHEFMREVRKEYDWPLGMPQHLWMKTVPSKQPYYKVWYHPATKETRGAWPCTYVSEAYNEDCYEALVALKSQ